MIISFISLIKRASAVLQAHPYVASCLLVAIAFFMFVFSLDRYPPFYSDEPGWNISAARYVDGRSFAYTLDSRAPHSDTIYNPHAPFFFRFQILTFKLLGISHFSCRIPSYIGAHLAVLLLCLFLARSKLPASAIALAVFWIGDRSTQYNLLGRVDGLSHFLVVLTFLFLVWGVIRQRSSFFFLVSLCLGLAAGFNPGACFFGFAALAAVFLLIPRHNWRSVLGMLILGGLLPVGLVLLCWAPDILASLEQFRYFYTFGTTGVFAPTLDRLVKVYGMLGWSGLLHIWLALVCAGFLVSVTVKRIRLVRSSCGMDVPSIIGICATLFALAAGVMFLNSSRCPYYLLYFTIWPMVAFLSFWESSAVRKTQIAVFRVMAVVLIACWLPSLAWNAMRFRETVLWWKMLDKETVSNELRLNIKSDAEVWGDPCYFVVVRNAGLSFTPLCQMPNDPGLTAPPRAWLVISASYVESFSHSNPSMLGERPLVHSGVMFRGSKYTEHQFFIYGPKEK